jgi:hypothetical protein
MLTILKHAQWVRSCGGGESSCGMIQGALLPSDHHRVSIDFVKDGCRDYNIPYEIDGSRCLVDLIGTPLK